MKGAVLLLLMAGAAFPLVVGYHVDPVKAQWSGWIGFQDTVSQVVTINFDSLTDPAYIECFVGDGNPMGYKVEVLTYPGQDQVAWGNGAASNAQAWARFSNLNVT